MAEIIRMPRMSDTMEEGVIASWLKKVGDAVKPGDILAEVETDKATMELEAYDEGTLLHIGVKEKETVPVDGVIAIIGEKGENIDSILSEIKSGSSAAPAAKETESPKVESTSKPAETAKAIDTSGIKATVIAMPRMSDTMTEGTLANWLKKVGDEIKAGDVLAEVETDKATMELEAYEDGTLLYIGAEAGSAVPVDGLIAVIGEKGADYQTLVKAHNASAKTEEKEETKEVVAQEAASAPKAMAESKPSNTPTSSTTTNGRIKASPLAKKLAEEKGFNIGQIAGTGEGGRIIKRDIENFSPSAQPSKAGSVSTTIVGQEGYNDIPASQMRKAIVKGLTSSQFGAPHFYLTMEIDMDKAIEARKSINEMSPVKISFNDIVVKAVAASLRKHPEVNTSWISESNSIRRHHHVHVGVAMAIEDGLVVPVVKFADNKSLSQISTEVKEFSGKAKDKKLSLDEMQGNTFTVSNLGMFGIEEFTSIINAPESCILAVGAIKQTPVVKNGQIVPGNIMKVTMTCDHRTVDGAVGAAFLVTLKNLMEDPVRILV